MIKGRKIRRVLFLADANSIHTARLANSLFDSGIKIKIVTLRPLHGQLYRPDITIHGVHLDRAPTRLETIWFLLVANFIVLFWRPNILHAHYCSSYGVLANKVFFVKKIISVWGSDILIRVKKSQKVRIDVEKSFKRANSIFCTSKYLADTASKYTTTPIFRTPFGINTKLFTPIGSKYEPVEKLKAQNPNLIVLGCPKWLNKIYGIDVLVESFHQIMKSNPDYELLLVLTGEGPDEKEIRARVDELGIKERVLFTGNIPHDQMPAIHRCLDIAIYASRSESFGVSILESSACGLPVIGTHEGGIPEVIKNTETGFLVRSNNTQSLSRSIVKYINDAELRKEHGQAGRRFVTQNFQWDHTVKKVIKLYEMTDEMKSIRNLVDAHPIFPNFNSFNLFHYPFPLEPHSQAARPIRVRSMKNLLASKRTTVEIMGNEQQKKRAFSLAKYYYALGMNAEHFYAESHSIPTLTLDNLKKLNFLDYSIFKWTKRKKIPSGVFLRDFYSFDLSLQSVVGIKRYRQLQFLQRLDLWAYKRYFSVVFVPCLPFAKQVKKFLPSVNVVPLPPGNKHGSVGLAPHVEQKGKLRLVYIGGLGYHYDLRHLMAAVALMPNTVSLDIICRPRDLTAQRSKIQKFINAENIRILHEDQAYFFENRTNWDMACLVRNSHSYIEMAYPVKIFDYVKVGLPILVSRGQYAEKIVAKNGLGVSVDNEVEKIMLSLDKISQNKHGLQKFRDNLQKFSEENTWAIRADKMFDVLNQIAQR